MGRPRKDNVPVSFRLERTVFDKLNQFCEDSGQAKTVAIERALGMYIDDYYEKQEIIKNNEQVIAKLDKLVRNSDSRQRRKPAKQDFKDKNKIWMIEAHFNKALPYLRSGKSYETSGFKLRIYSYSIIAI